MTFNQLYDEVLQQKLIQWTISNPRKKSESIKRMVIRPVVIGERMMFQIESFTKEQAFHENIDMDRLLIVLEEKDILLAYRQQDIFTEKQDFHVLVSKKGDMNVKRSEATKTSAQTQHNQEKQYILPVGEPIPFLVSLGIMTSTGKVVDKRYNKFKQINRFVEMVDDVIASLMPLQTTDKPLRIIDFGSGKSYLTFALYHYLVHIKQMHVDIVGLDLKKDVIEDCNQLKDRLNYEGLRFKVGNIEGYDEHNEVDMVVTLHACNTATDAALKKAVGWGAKVIMSVPCCQKEFNQQIDRQAFYGLLEHGIIKERVSALMTDALRAKWLQAMGYDVQLLEFVDMSHTPKNIMIRGLLVNQQDDHLLKEISSIQEALDVNLTIMKP